MIRCRFIEKTDIPPDFYVECIIRIRGQTLGKNYPLYPKLNNQVVNRTVSEVKQAFKDYLIENKKEIANRLNMNEDDVSMEIDQALGKFKCDDTIEKPIGYPL